MIVLQVNKLTKTFSGLPILQNVQLQVQHRDRVALVGRNGAGKSTLLKIIAGEMSYDSGDIIIPKDVSVGYLEQHAHLDSHLSIWDEMLTVFDDVLLIEREMRKAEIELGQINPENEVSYTQKLEQYAQLQASFEAVGGYQYESTIRTVLNGMQFFEVDHQKEVHTLSGGQKTRLALAKMLLEKPDLLILDEPTNHLDIETLSWLEKYLIAYEGAILIVSHDRYFLDQVVTMTYEVSRTEMTRYPGNYSYYLDEKAKSYEKDLKRFEREQTEKERLEEFVQKNIARASTSKMAKSRRKVLEKTNWMDSPDGDEKSASFSFDIARQSGNDVLAVDDLAIGYDDKIIAEHLKTRIYRKERIAIVGPNGIGKSTFLKTLIQQEEPLAGTIRFGTNVDIGYYDQEQATLNGNGTILQELWDEWPQLTEQKVRSILGRFLFSGEDVDKLVPSLSGGEKARLSLAKLMLLEANTLFLDEPTNHLDLDSKEVLENALDDFPGTLIFVSHDRYFINRLATKVIELTPKGIVEYIGDYTYYVNKKQELEELQYLAQQEEMQKSATPKEQVDHREASRARRKIERSHAAAEQQMQVLESEIEQLTIQMNQPEIADDHVQLIELQNQIDQLQEQHDEQSMLWLETAEALENL